MLPPPRSSRKRVPLAPLRSWLAGLRGLRANLTIPPMRQFLIFVVPVLLVRPSSAGDPPSKPEVLAAMRKAVAFMREEVSNRGGYLSLYTEDLSEQWGEIPARKSMIWVQDPGTVGVGRVLLEAYRVTGATEFLSASQDAADALLAGQHPSGGWHYFIDFDPAGTHEWHERVGSRCWGWEEFYYLCGNCTFDDHVMVGAGEFLLDMAEVTREDKYETALHKALEFFLDSQYPNGSWPQRYPPCQSEGDCPKPDYTAHATFNDGVILGNIEFLWRASERLGDSRLRGAALRGMAFVKAAQLAPPQAGWAQQYTETTRPAAARSYEPAAISTIDTLQAIGALETYFKWTGDRAYLEGIPKALDWLRNTSLPEGQREGVYTHGVFHELGTNLPLYAHREGTTKETGRYWIDTNPEDMLRGYGFKLAIDVEALEREFQRLSALTPKEARLEGEADERKRKKPETVSADKARKILESLDERGAWVEETSFPDTADYMNNPPRRFRGIRTDTFIANIQTWVDWLKTD